MLSAVPMLGIECELASYPKLSALKTHFEAIPEIAQWMKERPQSDY